LGTAVLLDGGNSSIITSKFYDANPILINNNTDATLTENIVDGSSSGMYAVYNNGDLWLYRNVFDNYIYNDGRIHTQTHTYFLNNDTWDGEWNTTFEFWANITDDNDNAIISVKTLNSTNNVTNDSFIMPYNKIKLVLAYQGVFLITGHDDGLLNNTIHTGILKVKVPTNINFNITRTNEGELVIIQAIVYPETSNYTFTGNVTFKINDLEYSREIVNGIATLELHNMTADTYIVTQPILATTTTSEAKTTHISL
jgi:hypothetical protein